MEQLSKSPPLVCPPPACWDRRQPHRRRRHQRRCSRQRCRCRRCDRFVTFVYFFCVSLCFDFFLYCRGGLCVPGRTRPVRVFYHGTCVPRIHTPLLQHTHRGRGRRRGGGRFLNVSVSLKESIFYKTACASLREKNETQQRRTVSHAARRAQGGDPRAE